VDPHRLREVRTGVDERGTGWVFSVGSCGSFGAKIRREYTTGRILGQSTCAGQMERG
jgi:hypothetical protein